MNEELLSKDKVIKELRAVVGKKLVGIENTYDWTVLVFEGGIKVKVDYFEIER